MVNKISLLSVLLTGKSWIKGPEDGVSLIIPQVSLDGRKVIIDPEGF